ncbi:MAG: hypothetical protein U0M41_06290, partial [Negativibacillus sp.]|nr:hypothetical protein [Negativibacillus sp.]
MQGGRKGAGKQKRKSQKNKDFFCAIFKKTEKTASSSQKQEVKKIPFFSKKVLTFWKSHSIIIYVVTGAQQTPPTTRSWEFSSAGRASAL